MSVPCVTEMPLLVTVAVKITVFVGAEEKEGLGDDCSVVNVTAGGVVVMVKVQPPAQVPLEPLTSSII